MCVCTWLARARDQRGAAAVAVAALACEEHEHRDVPASLLALVYEKPSAWPDWRPKRPFKLGPCLWAPPCRCQPATRARSSELVSGLRRAHEIDREIERAVCLLRSHAPSRPCGTGRIAA